MNMVCKVNSLEMLYEQLNLEFQFRSALQPAGEFHCFGPARDSDLDALGHVRRGEAAFANLLFVEKGKRETDYWLKEFFELAQTGTALVAAIWNDPSMRAWKWCEKASEIRIVRPQGLFAIPSGPEMDPCTGIAVVVFRRKVAEAPVHRWEWNWIESAQGSAI